jgi:uncharacterized protein (TIGR02246 family)
MITERVEAADVAKIYKLWNEYADAMNAENTERWRALFSNDSLQAPPDAPPQSGNTRILMGTLTQSDQYHSKLSINPEVVRILGDQAYTYGSFKTMLTVKAGEGRAIAQRNGKFLSILVKQPDGSWKILVDCFNNGSAIGQDTTGSKL